MKTITFAVGADVSDLFSSGYFREIVNTFLYNCETMYMLCSSEKNVLEHYLT